MNTYRPASLRSHGYDPRGPEGDARWSSPRHITNTAEYQSRYASGFEVTRYSASCSCGWSEATIPTRARAITAARKHTERNAR